MSRIAPPEDFDPLDYPPVLLESSICTKHVLQGIYRYIVRRAPELDKRARDAEIYERYTQGFSTHELAHLYGLSPSQVRRVIRQVERKN